MIPRIGSGVEHVSEIPSGLFTKEFGVSATGVDVPGDLPEASQAMC